MASVHHNIMRRIGAAYGLDVRSLAAMRIGLGVVLLTDLAIRAGDFTAMYTDRGFAPVGFVRGLQTSYQWSLHLASGSAWYQAVLFGIAAVLAVALVAGFHTRLATIGCWVLITSLQVRLPVVINAGDTLLRMLLFWGMFLPLGSAWSIDARRKAGEAAFRVASPATFALLVQLAIVYWVAGWAKWNDDWLREDALHDVLAFGLYSMPLAGRLAAYPDVTLWLSRATVWFELIAPFLLFIPWRVAPIRGALVVAFVLFHAGIAATVTVGLFSYVAIVAWLAILPSSFWDRLGSTAKGDPLDNAHAGAAPSLGRYAYSTFVAAALVVVVLWNVTRVTQVQLPGEAQRWLRTVANATMIRQAWSVFGRPPRYDCWYVYQARLANGETVDLWDSSHADVESRPALPSQQFANHRWRKLHWRLRLPSGKPYRQPVAEYACRVWNEAHPEEEQVVRLNVYCYRRPIAVDSAEQQVRESLAYVVLSDDGGNFADLARGLESY